MPSSSSVGPLRWGAAAAALLAVGGLGSLTGCSVDASDAAPAHRTFAYDGTTLRLKTHEIPAKVVVRDRHDIRVTRWFDAKAGSSKKLRWELKGDTLDLEAGCTGLALCDAKFRVEVPRGVKVVRGGQGGRG